MNSISSSFSESDLCQMDANEWKNYCEKLDQDQCIQVMKKCTQEAHCSRFKAIAIGSGAILSEAALFLLATVVAIAVAYFVGFALASLFPFVTVPLWFIELNTFLSYGAGLATGIAISHLIMKKLWDRIFPIAENYWNQANQLQMRAQDCQDRSRVLQIVS